MILKLNRMNKEVKDDCFFYFYSSCTKGDDCPYRHCQAALGARTVCSLWREGRCFQDNCKFRHMESEKNRAAIQCLYEDKPSGCLKPHCPYLHRKPKFNTQTHSGNVGLILPVSSTVPHISPSSKIAAIKDAVKHFSLNPVESYSSNVGIELNLTFHPVEPIVITLDDEESDSDSAWGSPKKSTSYDSNALKANHSDNLLENEDLRIKMLEQINIEKKLNNDSDVFYKSMYDSSLMDSVELKMKAEVYKTESLSVKKMICLKKSKDDLLDFKIKTLDEIRKEKLNKSEKRKDDLKEKNAKQSKLDFTSHMPSTL